MAFTVSNCCYASCYTQLPNMIYHQKRCRSPWQPGPSILLVQVIILQDTEMDFLRLLATCTRPSSSLSLFLFPTPELVVMFQWVTAGSPLSTQSCQSSLIWQRVMLLASRCSQWVSEMQRQEAREGKKEWVFLCLCVSPGLRRWTVYIERAEEGGLIR